MPNVFDNIETPFLENDAANGLKDALMVARRGDFCVGYFNLRGWHLSQDARDGIKEFRVPSEIRDHLLPFQEKAVQLACRHLNKRGGVLIGDVVGLGKTRIAAAIARVLGDDQMLETLILCPKNLQLMWNDYAHRFGLRAPKVLSQSVAQRDLPNLVRYRLVIVDESHNFRNREGKIYQAIQDYLFRNDCKVIRMTKRSDGIWEISSKGRKWLAEQKKGN